MVKEQNCLAAVKIIFTTWLETIGKIGQPALTGVFSCILVVEHSS